MFREIVTFPNFPLLISNRTTFQAELHVLNTWYVFIVSSDFSPASLGSHKKQRQRHQLD